MATVVKLSIDQASIKVHLSATSYMEADYGDTPCFMRPRERFRHGVGNEGFEGNMAITEVERAASDIVKNFDTIGNLNSTP